MKCRHIGIMIIVVMMVFALCAASSHADQYDSSLVGYWKMEGDWSDSSGSGNTGTGAGNVSFVAGQLGQGTYFDGNDDYVNLGNASSLNPTNAISISAWINRTGGGSAVISKYSHGSPDERSWNLRVAGGSIYVDIWEGFGDYKRYSAFPSLSGWHHITTTFATSTNELKIYLDGSELGSITKDSDSHISSIYTGSQPVRLGTEWYQGAPYAEITGTIDEVGIWNKALSSEEVYQNYVSQHIAPDITDGATRISYEAYLDTLFSGNLDTAGVSYDQALLEAIIDAALDDAPGTQTDLGNGLIHYEPVLTGSGTDLDPYAYDFAAGQLFSNNWDWGSISGYDSLTEWYATAEFGSVLTEGGEWVMKTGGTTGSGGDPVPELPPFAMQGMVMAFGGVGVWFRKFRK